jgi:hypothetical protein
LVFSTFSDFSTVVLIISFLVKLPIAAEYERLIPLVDKLAKLSAKDLRVVEGLVEILLNE